MDILISAGEGLKGYEIAEYKEIIFGVGNSSEDGGTYRQIAMERASASAEKLGANGIVNMRIEIYRVGEGVSEATVYGNAVVLKPVTEEKKERRSGQRKEVDNDKYVADPKIEGAIEAELSEINGYKFVICPKCKSKYKADITENGELRISGFDDVDDIEPGLQIYCLRCGQKFTVPEKFEV